MLALVELAKPRIEVAANRREPRAGNETRQLRDPPHTAGADRRRPPESTSERVHAVDPGPWALGLDWQHHRVERIFARQHAGDRQTVGQSHGHVLAAVHSEVDVSADERVLYFLDEQPLSAHFRERSVLQPVA